MRLSFKNRNGFSLVELIIAMVLLVSVGSLTMYAFTSSAKMAQPGGSVAYNVGRGLMEQMFEYVRQDRWATAGLPLSYATVPQPGTSTALSAFTPQSSTKTLNGKTYTATYVVNNNSGVPIDANADGKEDYRKVKMTITW